MYLYRGETHGLQGPGLAVGIAIATFLFGFWSALQAGANFGVVVVNFFTTLPILVIGIGAIIYYCNFIPRWAGISALVDLMWFLAYPVRHSVAEIAREMTESGNQAWLGYLDARIVEWGVFVVLAVVAAMLFRRRC